MDVWNPVIGEILQLHIEPNNIKDTTAVAVKMNTEIVGHMPKLLSATVFHFLSRPCNSGIVEITGQGMGWRFPVCTVFVALLTTSDD